MKNHLSAEHFQTEEAAFAYVEAKLWANGPVCHHCGETSRIGRLQGKTNRAGLYKCYACRKPFTVRMGTIFELSHVPLRVWLQVMYLVCSSKKGISTNQIQRTLQCSMKTAWFLTHRIRECMKETHAIVGPLGGAGSTIEADEITKNGYDGDKAPVIRGSAFKALNATSADSPDAKPILDLVKAMDDYFPDPVRELDKPFLMPIEDIFSIEGRGTVVTGRIERGKVKVNEEVEVVGLKPTAKTVVTGIEMFNKSLDEGRQATTPVCSSAVSRKRTWSAGRCSQSRARVTPHSEFEGEIYVLSKEEGGRHSPFFKGYKPQFYIRTTDVTGEVTLPEGMEMVMPGDTVKINGQAHHPGRDGRQDAFRHPRRRQDRRRRRRDEDHQVAKQKAPLFFGLAPFRNESRKREGLFVFA